MTGNGNHVTMLKLTLTSDNLWLFLDLEPLCGSCMEAAA